MPNRLVATGAYRPIGLQAVGFDVRIDGGHRPGGLHFVFRGDVDSSFAVTVRGRRRQGRPLILLRGAFSPDDARRHENLLKSSENLADKTAWFGTAPGVVTGDGANQISFDATHTYLYQPMERQTEDGAVYQVSFRGRLLSGSSELTVFLNRGGGYDGQAQNVRLTPEWRRFTFFHDGKWTARTSLQMGFQRLNDMVFQVRDVRVTQAPSANELARSWPDSLQLPAAVLSTPPVDAPDGERTFILRQTDSIGVLVYGTTDFSYQLDRICVDPIERDDEAPERAAACKPVTQ